MTKKERYPIIVSGILSLAVPSLFPLGLLTIAIMVLCFGLSLFLIIKTTRGVKNVKRT